MNIIIDSITHDKLQEHVIDTIEFGSVMKGTNDNDSDHDYLHIISPSIHWLQAPYSTHHLLQYRDVDSDHMYCTPHTFVKSLLDGDSTIFHEMLVNGALHDTCLSFIENFSFDHYKTMRSYLGIARRDLKDVTKLFSSDKRKALKKFKFANIGYNYVRQQLGQSTESWNVSDNIKDVLNFCKYADGAVGVLRTEINNMLDYQLLSRSVDETTLSELETHLHAFEFESYKTGLEFFRDVYLKGE